MPDLIPAKDGIFDRHPVFFRIPACAGMTNFGYLTTGGIMIADFGVQFLNPILRAVKG